MDLNVKKINESLEKAEASALEPWYRTNKYGDWILDHIAYGWRIYYKYYDVKRWFISTYQRMRYGVSDSECWSLDWTLTNFILPRLKHFKKINVHTHPPDITPERWEEILDELIWTFEYMHDEESSIQLLCLDTKLVIWKIILKALNVKKHQNKNKLGLNI